ncbi:MAG: hypothetical protein A2580_06085 [Hydrogenophilales bacterium RIFOXYD1_FULL_62_11]|nr:MAG: hypothetical protein A2580_06085 [Hydrogenophilales bacterium RIFOXYD1_FULL_62_11]
MNIVANKLTGGIRKVKAQQTVPAATAKQPAPQVDQGKTEPAAIPGRIGTGSAFNSSRVWPA